MNAARCLVIPALAHASLAAQARAPSGRVVLDCAEFRAPALVAAVYGTVDLAATLRARGPAVQHARLKRATGASAVTIVPARAGAPTASAAAIAKR
ncbi:MAG TPA: hypothetical protein VGC30_10540 [Dokdonella sp.]